MSAQVITALRRRAAELDTEAESMEAQGTAEAPVMLRWLAAEFRAVADTAEGQQVEAVTAGMITAEITRLESELATGPGSACGRSEGGGEALIPPGYRPVILPGYRPVMTDTAAALRTAGLRDEIHPVDAYAFIYPDAAYFERSAAREREIHHNDVHGPYDTPEGLLGIVDMRPQVRERGWRVADPELPDDWTGP